MNGIDLETARQQFEEAVAGAAAARDAREQARAAVHTAQGVLFDAEVDLAAKEKIRDAAALVLLNAAAARLAGMP